MLGVLQHPVPRFWGPAIGRSGQFLCAVYRPINRKIWALAAVEQQQYMRYFQVNPFPPPKKKKHNTKKQLVLAS